MNRLEVSHISKTFTAGFWGRNKVKAVEDVSFSLPRGKTLGLVGMSGSGKSTVARMVIGLLRPDSGSVLFEGENLIGATGKKRQMLCRRMQMLFQHPTSALNPRFTMQESMLEPFLLHPDIAPKSQWQDRIREQLAYVSLAENLLDRYPHQLSGGQIQRFCLARILLLQPALLVLDEPTSMLDVSVQAQVMDLLAKIQAEMGMSYLFISHDLDLVRAYSDEIAVMYQGCWLEQQTPENLYAHPKELYTKELIAAFTQI